MESNMNSIKITNRNIMFTKPSKKWDCDLNLGLILGQKHNFIIDTGCGSGDVAPILDYIGDDTKPIIVINTHHHWDHVWGNWVFGNSLIISHATCRETLEKCWDDDINDKNKSDFINGEVRKCLPNMTFKKRLDFPEDGVSIFHSPGHTADDISVYDAVDKVLYAGDNIGDTDEVIVPEIDTDLETFQALINTYKEYDFDICISGHNTPQTKEVLVRMAAALPSAWEKQREIR